MQIQYKHITVKILHIALFGMENSFFFGLNLVLEHEETEVLELLKCHTFVFNKIFLITLKLLRAFFCLFVLIASIKPYNRWLNLANENFATF